ncbi:vomeronasal type-1 receptor 90-like [Fukomys damarensis]|uniref:vomeronasal type-1 receptor 90-like n=1 Tax=Fukomys damarensis TaxID=885580 RepID=UPI001454FC32|nr:vomeronasal type-1 receptor 90-like [Fukomys damarensis]
MLDPQKPNHTQEFSIHSEPAGTPRKRDFSIKGGTRCPTCLLSVLQVVSLSPGSSLAKVQPQIPTPHGGFIFIFIAGTPNGTSYGLVFLSKSCSLWPLNYVLRHRSPLGTSIPLLGLMAIVNGYVVTLLCRHERQPGSSTAPASRTILLFMPFFVVMSILDCISSYSGMTYMAP